MHSCVGHWLDRFNFRPVSTWLAAIVLFGLAGNAFAVNGASFVSQSGDDSLPCTMEQPCRTFARAVAQTKATGTVVAQPGSYPPFTLLRSVNIVSATPGAAVIQPGQGKTGLSVSLPANQTVTLDGLRFEGTGFAAELGVYVDSASSTVNVLDCRFGGFDSAGLTVVNALAVSVKNSLFSRSATGLIIDSGSTSPTVSVVGTSFVDNNINTFLKSGTPNVVFDGTTMAQSYYGGLVVRSGNVFLRNSTVSGDGTVGVQADGGNVSITQSTITQNKVGVILNGGTVTTFKNNSIKANQTDVSGGSLTAAAQN